MIWRAGHPSVDEAYHRITTNQRLTGSQSGLLVRKEPLAVGDIITIEINSNCTARSGLFSKFAGYTGKLFQAAGN
jgi:flagellar basal body L-ring protein FlgH